MLLILWARGAEGQRQRVSGLIRDILMLPGEEGSAGSLGSRLSRGRSMHADIEFVHGEIPAELETAEAS